MHGHSFTITPPLECLSSIYGYAAELYDPLCQATTIATLFRSLAMLWSNSPALDGALVPKSSISCKR